MKPIYQAIRRHLDPSSLQLQLTVEIALLVTLCSIGVAVWTSWQMQQLAIAIHTQRVEYIATRFPRDVEIYSEMLPVAIGLQKTIDNVSVPGLAIWVKNPDGKQLLSRTSGVNVELMSITDMPIEPQVYQVGDRYLILYRGAVIVKGNLLGKVYMAQDVTIARYAYLRIC